MPIWDGYLPIEKLRLGRDEEGEGGDEDAAGDDGRAGDPAALLQLLETWNLQRGTGLEYYFASSSQLFRPVMGSANWAASGQAGVAAFLKRS